MKRQVLVILLGLFLIGMIGFVYAEQVQTITDTTTTQTCSLGKPSFSIIPLSKTGSAGDTLSYRFKVINDNANCSHRWFSFVISTPIVVPINMTLDDCNKNPPLCDWRTLTCLEESTNQYPKGWCGPIFKLQSGEKAIFVLNLTSKSNWPEGNYRLYNQFMYSIPGQEVNINFSNNELINFYYVISQTSSCKTGCTCDSEGNPITCESCTEGATKKYTCSDGTQVDWCTCTSDGLWVCVMSPEIKCKIMDDCTSDGDCPTSCGCLPDSNITCSCSEMKCINGKCGYEQVSEKITCKFEGTENDQACYLAGQWGKEDEGTKFCDAEDGNPCVISYTSYKGEAVTWKSSCGQLQYTTQDGNDETIYFKCNEGETNITEIKGNGFRYAKWECYDGFEGKAGDENSCYSSDSFHMKAKDDCEGHCKGEKCGINSFAVGGDCYFQSDIPDCSQLNCANAYYDYDLKECRCSDSNETTSEPNIICRDACALDGKCYPTNNRKAGKYCTVDGSFVNQLIGDAVCDNNFECGSNVCAGGKCLSQGLLEKIMAWFKNLFG